MHKRLLYAACLLTVATGAGAVDAPAVLNQTAYDGKSLTLSWSAVEGATGYHVSVWGLGESTSEAEEVNLVINKDNPVLYTPAINGHLDEAILTFKVSETTGIQPQETLPLIFRQADADHEVSSILRADIYMGQLEPYNQLSTNTIFGGYPMDEFSQCIYIQAGPQGQEPTGAGTLTITRVQNIYRPNIYVKENEAVGANVTEMSVTGLELGKDYYAIVKAVQGSEVSRPSEILHLNSVLPTRLTGATDFSADSYTANWEVNHKAASYVVTNYEVLKAGDTPIELVLLEDNFDKATEGTFEKPVERIAADDYTVMPGWTVKSAIAAKGMFGTFNGMLIGSTNYGGGEMATPPLGFANGSATVEFRLQSSMPSEDEIIVYIGDYNPDNAVSIAVPASGIVEETVTLPGASDGARVHFDSKQLKKFMLDNVKISQSLAPGQKSYHKLTSAEISDGTSHTFTGLEAESEYAYSVRTDYFNFFGGVEQGQESPILEVGSFAGVENVAVDSVLSPVVSVILTDLSGRRVLDPAKGSVVIRTEVRADGSASSAKYIVR